MSLKNYIITKLNSKYFRVLAWLSIGVFFSVLLLFIRLYITRSFFFSFLIWNLFLACVPLIISGFIIPKTRNKNVWILYTYSFIWLLFLPNAPYILTDFIHFKWQTQMPHWFDILLISSFALNGFLMGVFSMLQMSDHLERLWPKRIVFYSMLAVCFLCGFGIYLGRFLRFNSWDIITNPLQLINSISVIFTEPVNHLSAWGITLGFGMLLLTFFGFLKSNVFAYHKD